MSTGWPSSSRRPYANNRSVWSLINTMVLVSSTTTIASGIASISAPNSSSASRVSTETAARGVARPRVRFAGGDITEFERDGTVGTRTGFCAISIGARPAVPIRWIPYACTPLAACPWHRSCPGLRYAIPAVVLWSAAGRRPHAGDRERRPRRHRRDRPRAGQRARFLHARRACRHVPLRYLSRRKPDQDASLSARRERRRRDSLLRAQRERGL